MISHHSLSRRSGAPPVPRRRPNAPDIIGERLHQAIEHGVARKTEDIVDAVGFTPTHDFRAAIMSIPPDVSRVFGQ